MAEAGGRLKSLQGVTPRDMFKIDPRIIQIRPSFNPRDYNTAENQAHIRALADSIKQVGVLNPVIVTYEQGTVWLDDGECRLRGTLLAIEEGAEILSIPAMTEVARTNDADRLLNTIVRNTGKQLTQLEKGDVYNRLMAMGWDEERIATKLGVSLGHVKETLVLYAAPEQVKNLVRSNKVSSSMALHAVRDHGNEKALEVLSAAVEHAASEGKERATPKNLRKTGGEKAKKRRGVLLYYQREQVKVFIDVMVEVAANTELPRSVRDKVKDALRNGDVDWKTWGNELT